MSICIGWIAEASRKREVPETGRKCHLSTEVWISPGQKGAWHGGTEREARMQAAVGKLAGAVGGSLEVE